MGPLRTTRSALVCVYRRGAGTVCVPGFHTITEKTTIRLSLFVLTGCWTGRKNGFLLVVTRQLCSGAASLLFSRICFSVFRDWFDLIFPLGVGSQWDLLFHNGSSSCPCQSFLISFPLVGENTVEALTRNVSSSLIVKDSQFPHQFLMNASDFFQSYWDEMPCWCEGLLHLNNHLLFFKR